MSLLDRVVAATLPYVPKPVVGAFARRYIAGERLDDAVATVRALNAEETMATVDVLGEDVFERDQALATVAEYERAIDAIVQHRLDCNVSVKLTALGLKIDHGFCRENLQRIVDRAGAHGMFVRIDMEDVTCTDATLALYRDLHARTERVGPVLQAYLRRSLKDARALLADPPLNVRLCKGIYNESPTVAFKDRDVIRRSYANLLDVFLRGGAYVGIATHDEVLVYEALQRIDALGLTPDRYEFQMLLGVLPQLRRTLIADGHRLRVYVPYGPHWHGYSVRRLRENPSIAGHVLKSFVRRNGA